jgi:DNA-binding MarR family transcriptional regulator
VTTLISIAANDTHYVVTLDEIRAVWALVSANPIITVREIARVIYTSPTRAHAILIFLERCGYIRTQFGKTGRTVLIPLISKGTALPKEPLTVTTAEQPR